MVLGAQRPRVLSVPARSSTERGDRAVELARRVGLELDPWQAFAVREALATREDGRWSAFEVGLVVPRQNGKGAVLEAVELAGLFLFGEELILHSAHEFKTAAEAFRRVLFWVENHDDLRSQVARVRTSHGEEGIELRSGARLRFVARSTGSGRGFTGDRVILDESYNLGDEAMGALLPTLSARPNPQLWYTSSSGMLTSTQLRSVRDRGYAGDDPHLCYLEWSAEPDADPSDPAVWAQANPAMGLRIDPDHIAREAAALAGPAFGRERLGWWDEAGVASVIPPRTWAVCQSEEVVGDRVAFGFDVAVDRSASVIVAAGRTPSGGIGLEVVDARPGTDWVAARLAELAVRHRPLAVTATKAGPVTSLIPDVVTALEETDVPVETVAATDLGAACGRFYDLAMRTELRHRGDPVLSDSVAGAARRYLSGAWTWERTKVAVDAAPVVAATVAVSAFLEHEEDDSEPAVFVL